MSAHVLFDLLRDEENILSLSHNELNKLNNTGVQMLEFIHQMTFNYSKIAPLA